MKKTMIILLCIISLLSSIAFAFYEKAHDNERLDKIESNENSTYFYVKGTQVSVDEELEEFSRISQKYQATIIRTDKLFKNSEEINYKSGIYSDGYFKNMEPNLVEGTIPHLDNEFLATYKTGKQNQSGMIRDLFKDYLLIFGDLATFYQENESSVSGNYTLIVATEDKDEVVYQLAIFFGTTKEDLLTPNTGTGYGEGTIFLLSIVFAVIVFAIFCLMNTFYPISRLKEIGVMKLHGFKNFDIWKQLNGKVLMIPVVFYLITIVVQKVFIKDSDIEYFTRLSLIQAGIFVICLLFSLLMLVVIRKFSISSMLKNFFSFRFSLYFSYILKSLMFIGLILTLPLMTREFETLLKELSVRHIYESEEHYLTLSDFQYMDDEFQDFLNGNDVLGNKLTNMYKELEQTAECQYIVTERVQPIISSDIYTEKWANISFNSNDSYNLVQANKNYLKTLDFDLPLSLANLYNKESLTFLVPDSLKAEENKVEYLVRERSRGFILTNEEEETTKLEDLPVRIIYYPDNNKKIFSENLEMIDIDNGFVQNPIILCLNDNFFSERTSRLQNMALYNPIRILDTEENQKAIKEAILNNGLEQNSVRFGSVLSTGFAQELEISKTSMIAWISIIFLALLVSILASYYIILIILASRKKEMLVSRILGYSIFDRYHNEIFYFAAIYCFGFAQIMITSRQLIPMISYIILILIDMCIIYLMVRIQEGSSLNLALKGEE